MFILRERERAHEGGAERERESTHRREGQREREREREIKGEKSQAGSIQFSSEPDLGLRPTECEIMT